jgi:glycogen(starch) synthase
MRILHLAYEDPLQPGSGGGAVRTREINRRLSERHEITAIVAGYKGAKTRVEDGVRWIPLGLRAGIKLGRLSYFALLSAAIRAQNFDLLVEDFGAPFSVGFSPLFTRRPVVASVQWLFASEKRAKYHLPFDWVEGTGLRLYDDFVVVSEWLADSLGQRRPNTKIEVIPNGVDVLAFSTPPLQPKHLLFVGRLEIQQKGCDMLLESIALVRQILGDQMPPVVIVGDGPDQPVLAQQVQRLGLSDRVAFRGRVEGEEKFRLMANAYALLMPSRWETFGMVAVEAQAAGAPVVAFDVGPLAEVAGPGGARLVTPFDLDAYAQEIAALVRSPRLFERLRNSGRKWARRYDWDQIAVQQEEHYLRALETAKQTARFAISA